MSPDQIVRQAVRVLLADPSALTSEVRCRLLQVLAGDLSDANVLFMEAAAHVGWEPVELVSNSHALSGREMEHFRGFAMSGSVVLHADPAEYTWCSFLLRRTRRPLAGPPRDASDMRVSGVAST